MRFCCENIVHQQKLYDDIRRDTQRLRSRFSFRKIIINVARRQFRRRRNGNFVYISFERMRCRFGLTEINWMAHTTTHMPSCGTCLCFCYLQHFIWSSNSLTPLASISITILIFRARRREHGCVSRWESSFQLNDNI